MREETAQSAIDTFLSAFNALDDHYVTELLSQALTTPGGGPRLTGTDVVHFRRGLIDQVIVFAGEIEPSAP
ncbi:hypothetical protein [Streptomyces sp. DH8]|uniref:hypothetical protein n=1 Tax=Streptomyces sp. DH8 TaxID=2857008 RepID=UPI001E4CF923|nr:hypothetical protein [Streptomyces sp. DH8]